MLSIIIKSCLYSLGKFLREPSWFLLKHQLIIRFFSHYFSLSLSLSLSPLPSYQLSLENFINLGYHYIIKLLFYPRVHLPRIFMAIMFESSLLDLGLERGGSIPRPPPSYPAIAGYNTMDAPFRRHHIPSPDSLAPR